MKIINVEQGSQKWHEHRRTHHNASDAPAMMGVSKHISRDEFIKLQATGDEAQHSAYVQDVIFATGHKIEVIAREIAEQIIDEDLYPMVGEHHDHQQYGASFDGITLDCKIICECKSWSQDKADSIDNGIIPPCDAPQITHQFYVSGAQECIYIIAKLNGADKHLRVKRDEDAIIKLIASWQQFDVDVDAYKHATAPAEVIARDVVSDMIVLNVSVESGAITSNLDAYANSARQTIARINTDFNTDADFADGEKAVKFLKNVEQSIDAAINNAIKQAAPLNQLLTTLKEIKDDLARQKRLEIERAIKARKEEIRFNIKNDAVISVQDNIHQLNDKLGKPYMPALDVATNIINVMKGRRTLKGLNEAVNAERARLNVEATLIYTSIKDNLDLLKDKASGHKALFRDTKDLVLKQHDDLADVITARIAEHKEEVRIQAERDAEAKAEAAKAVEAALMQEEAEQKRINEVKAAATEKQDEIKQAQISQKFDEAATNKQTFLDNVEKTEQAMPGDAKVCLSCGSNTGYKYNPVRMHADKRLYVIDCKGCNDFTSLTIVEHETTQDSKKLLTAWNEYQQG